MNDIERFATMTPEMMDEYARDYGEDMRRSVTPEVVDRSRSRLSKHLRKDWLVKRFLLASNATDGKGPRLTEAWMALAEQRTWSLMLASDAPLEIIDGHHDETQELKRTRIAYSLLCSQTYLWSASVFNAIRACPLPAHVVDRDVLPFPFTYHTTEVAYQVTNPEGSPHRLDDRGYEMDWTHCVHVPNGGGFSVISNAVPNDRTSARKIICAGVKYGVKFPDDFPAFSVEPTRVVLSLLAFLKSPYASIGQRLLPRGLRRSKECVSSDEDRTVSVVTLRRDAKESLDRYEAEPREWKHKWWVAGHFRSQWFPSRQAHELVWIAPYIKGPSEAPMLEKVYVVVR